MLYEGLLFLENGYKSMRGSDFYNGTCLLGHQFEHKRRILMERQGRWKSGSVASHVPVRRKESEEFEETI